MDYTPQIQKLFLEFMLSDPELFVRVSNIYNFDNFDKTLKKAAQFIAEYAATHNIIPNWSQINAVSVTKFSPVDGIAADHISWFLEEFEKFTRRQELERAILKAADLLEKGEYDPVEKLVKDAVHISLTKDMGTDYFADPRTRLMRLKSTNGQVSTGWPQLDHAIYGGFNRKELEIVAGASGSGKSLVLQNLACNWTLMNLNGIYVTLELSEDLCAMRIDSMLTHISSRELFKDLDQVELKVRMLAKRAGNLKIKYMPAQSTVNDIRAYVKELQIREGIILDYICVDYLDLMTPVSVKVNASDTFTKDKYVSEELRNLANELNVVLMSASQLNRSSVEEVEFDHSHIAGGISKIYTADNVMGIFTSRAMRERGKYQLQLMKTRNSSGVNKKIDLDFDPNCLRITDNGEQEQESQPDKISQMMSQIKTGSRVVTREAAEDQVGRTVKADVQGSKLKNMLAQLKKSND